jgi:hypothetical protein
MLITRQFEQTTYMASTFLGVLLRSTKPFSKRATADFAVFLLDGADIFEVAFLTLIGFDVLGTLDLAFDRVDERVA